MIATSLQASTLAAPQQKKDFLLYSIIFGLYVCCVKCSLYWTTLESLLLLQRSAAYSDFYKRDAQLICTAAHMQNILVHSFPLKLSKRY